MLLLPDLWVVESPVVFVLNIGHSGSIFVPLEIHSLVNWTVTYCGLVFSLGIVEYHICETFDDDISIIPPLFNAINLFRCCVLSSPYTL